MRLVYLLFALLIFMGCKKEDSIKSKLTFGNGKWKIGHYQRNLWNPSGNIPNSIIECNDCGEITFNRNKTGELLINNTGTQFKYTLSGENLVLYVDENGISYNISWNWKKKKFILTSNLGQAGFSEVFYCQK